MSFHQDFAFLHETYVKFDHDRRFIRNAKQRQDAREEQLRAPQNKMESQVYHARCSQSPQVLVFHPFEPHLAVALKDCFGYLNFFLS